MARYFVRYGNTFGDDISVEWFADSGLAHDWAIDNLDGEEFDVVEITPDTFSEILDMLNDGVYEDDVYLTFLNEAQGFHYVTTYYDSWDDFAEDVQNAYAGEYDNREDWAQTFLTDTGFFHEISDSNIRETVEMYFNFDDYARDAELSGDISLYDVTNGVIAFHSTW